MFGRLVIWFLNFFRGETIDAEIDANRAELMRERVQRGHAK